MAKYTALVVMMMVMAVNANTVVQQASLEDMLAETKLNGLGVTADVNDYVDTTISMIVPLLEKYGLDPMPLPEVVEGFEVRYLLITYSAWLKIHDGSMTGMVNVKRSGDQLVNYFAKMLRVRVELQFSDLLINYRYLVQVMNIGPTGGIRAGLDSFKVVVDLLLDFNNDEVHLQEFALNDIGRLSVRLTGNLLAWLINPVITVFTRIFDTTIIRVIESTIRTVVQMAILFINGQISDIFAALEAM